MFHLLVRPSFYVQSSVRSLRLCAAGTITDAAYVGKIVPTLFTMHYQSMLALT